MHSSQELEDEICRVRSVIDTLSVEHQCLMNRWVLWLSHLEDLKEIADNG